MAKIVVTTPTGNVGSRVVRLLIQAGARPTLLMRDPGKLDAETAAAVDALEVDQQDRDAVVQATAGTDALYWVDPPTDDEDPLAKSTRMAETAAAAVTENGIGHVVFQSSIGAEKRGGAGDIDGLARHEVALDGTGASVLHLRCGYFFTNLVLDPGALESGVLPVLFATDAPMAWVDPRDIGDIVAARLLAADWSGRLVQAVHGPEHLSFDQATAIVSRVTGRPFAAQRIEDDEMRSALSGVGMTDLQVESIVGMAIGLREGFEPEDPRTVVTTTPTTLASWAVANLTQP